MRWNEKDRESIQKMVTEYKRRLKGKRPVFFKIPSCPFCKIYQYCSSCPNVTLTKLLLNVPVPYSIFDCNNNLNHFYINKYLNRNDTKTKKCRFRLRMWQDALRLTHKEFKKKYKRRK